MSGKVKAAKVKVHGAPAGSGGLDGQFHVYVFDVFHREFLPGRVFDNIERAAAFQRHEQERIFVEQEAEPELFDLPFISDDPELLRRVESDAAYKSQLMRDLDAEARARARAR